MKTHIRVNILSDEDTLLVREFLNHLVSIIHERMENTLILPIQPISSIVYDQIPECELGNTITIKFESLKEIIKLIFDKKRNVEN